ncbi:hypothetical protein FNF27_07413 [Cafeteria roenbergensis]|uniref:Uncharacterized protein n=2 Tax=Cafeteria roenbergensis TaxID=33653 RepID=A0A5A8DNH4_CAFRO|nr:hypothetical protein FNF27_07413 [Cafeteria roenbergensis]
MWVFDTRTHQWERVEPVAPPAGEEADDTEVASEEETPGANAASGPDAAADEADDAAAATAAKLGYTKPRHSKPSRLDQGPVQPVTAPDGTFRALPPPAAATGGTGVTRRPKVVVRKQRAGAAGSPDAARSASGASPDQQPGHRASQRAGGQRVRPAVPAARRGHILTPWCDSAGRLWLVLFGGAGSGSRGDNSPLADVWAFHVEERYWRELRPRKSLRSDSSMGLDSMWEPVRRPGEAPLAGPELLVPPPRSSSAGTVVGDALFVFGGATPRGPSNDLWVFNLTAQVWKRVHASLPTDGPAGHVTTPAGRASRMPPARYGHAVVPDPWQPDAFLVLGGRGPRTPEPLDNAAVDRGAPLAAGASGSLSSLAFRPSVGGLDGAGSVFQPDAGRVGAAVDCLPWRFDCRLQAWEPLPLVTDPFRELHEAKARHRSIARRVGFETGASGHSAGATASPRTQARERAEQEHAALLAEREVRKAQRRLRQSKKDLVRKVSGAAFAVARGGRRSQHSRGADGEGSIGSRGSGSREGFAAADSAARPASRAASGSRPSATVGSPASLASGDEKEEEEAAAAAPEEEAEADNDDEDAASVRPEVQGIPPPRFAAVVAPLWQHPQLQRVVGPLRALLDASEAGAVVTGAGPAHHFGHPSKRPGAAGGASKWITVPPPGLGGPFTEPEDVESRVKDGEVYGATSAESSIVRADSKCRRVLVCGGLRTDGQGGAASMMQVYHLMLPPPPRRGWKSRLEVDGISAEVLLRGGADGGEAGGASASGAALGSAGPSAAATVLRGPGQQSPAKAAPEEALLPSTVRGVLAAHTAPAPPQPVVAGLGKTMAFQPGTSTSSASRAKGAVAGPAAGARPIGSTELFQRSRPRGTGNADSTSHAWNCSMHTLGSSTGLAAVTEVDSARSPSEGGDAGSAAEGASRAEWGTGALPPVGSASTRLEDYVRPRQLRSVAVLHRGQHEAVGMDGTWSYRKGGEAEDVSADVLKAACAAAAGGGARPSEAELDEAEVQAQAAASHRAVGLASWPIAAMTGGALGRSGQAGWQPSTQYEDEPSRDEQEPPHWEEGAKQQRDLSEQQFPDGQQLRLFTDAPTERPPAPPPGAFSSRAASPGNGAARGGRAGGYDDGDDDDRYSDYERDEEAGASPRRPRARGAGSPPLRVRLSPEGTSSPATDERPFTTPAALAGLRRGSADFSSSPGEGQEGARGRGGDERAIVANLRSLTPLRGQLSGRGSPMRSPMTAPAGAGFGSSRSQLGSGRGSALSRRSQEASDACADVEEEDDLGGKAAASAPVPFEVNRQGARAPTPGSRAHSRHAKERGFSRSAEHGLAPDPFPGRRSRSPLYKPTAIEVALEAQEAAADRREMYGSIRRRMLQAEHVLTPSTQDVIGARDRDVALSLLTPTQRRLHEARRHGLQRAARAVAPADDPEQALSLGAPGSPVRGRAASRGRALDASVSLGDTARGDATPSRGEDSSAVLAEMAAASRRRSDSAGNAASLVSRPLRSRGASRQRPASPGSIGVRSTPLHGSRGAGGGGVNGDDLATCGPPSLAGAPLLPSLAGSSMAAAPLSLTSPLPFAAGGLGSVGGGGPVSAVPLAVARAMAGPRLSQVTISRATMVSGAMRHRTLTAVQTAELSDPELAGSLREAGVRAGFTAATFAPGGGVVAKALAEADLRDMNSSSRRGSGQAASRARRAAAQPAVVPAGAEDAAGFAPDGGAWGSVTPSAQAAGTRVHQRIAATSGAVQAMEGTAVTMSAAESLRRLRREQGRTQREDVPGAVAGGPDSVHRKPLPLAVRLVGGRQPPSSALPEDVVRRVRARFKEESAMGESKSAPALPAAPGVKGEWAGRRGHTLAPDRGEAPPLYAAFDRSNAQSTTELPASAVLDAFPADRQRLQRITGGRRGPTLEEVAEPLMKSAVQAARRGRAAAHRPGPVVGTRLPDGALALDFRSVTEADGAEAAQRREVQAQVQAEQQARRATKVGASASAAVGPKLRSPPRAEMPRAPVEGSGSDAHLRLVMAAGLPTASVNPDLRVLMRRAQQEARASIEEQQRVSLLARQAHARGGTAGRPSPGGQPSAKSRLERERERWQAEQSKYALASPIFERSEAQRRRKEFGVAAAAKLLSRSTSSKRAADVVTVPTRSSVLSCRPGLVAGTGRVIKARSLAEPAMRTTLVIPEDASAAKAAIRRRSALERSLVQAGTTADAAIGPDLVDASALGGVAGPDGNAAASSSGFGYSARGGVATRIFVSAFDRPVPTPDLTLLRRSLADRRAEARRAAEERRSEARQVAATLAASASAPTL